MWFSGYDPDQYSSIAQSVEHAAVNRAVVGSSPTRGADCSIADFAIEFFTLQEIPQISEIVYNKMEIKNDMTKERMVNSAVFRFVHFRKHTKDNIAYRME